MKLHIPVLIGCLLFVSAAAVRADAPLYSIWVKLDINSCKPITYRPPLFFSNHEYERGDSYTTNVVRGKVAHAGVLSHGRPQSDADEWGAKQLPQSGATLQVALANFDPSFCAAVLGKSIKFSYDYRCDVTQRTGACIASDQLVNVMPEPTDSRQ